MKKIVLCQGKVPEVGETLRIILTKGKRPWFRGRVLRVWPRPPGDWGVGDWELRVQPIYNQEDGYWGQVMGRTQEEIERITAEPGETGWPSPQAWVEREIEVDEGGRE